jgi:hypothetical protein
MEFSQGKTWEKPGGSWEKFQIWLDQNDYLQLCEEMKVTDPSAIPLRVRHLMLRTLASRIEAVETGLRGYITKEAMTEQVNKAKKDLETLTASYVPKPVPVSA